ncbi:hypothetical protein WJX77_010116 [Trebouxia sp. C0004]
MLQDRVSATPSETQAPRTSGRKRGRIANLAWLRSGAEDHANENRPNTSPASTSSDSQLPPPLNTEAEWYKGLGDDDEAQYKRQKLLGQQRLCVLIERTLHGHITDLTCIEMTSTGWDSLGQIHLDAKIRLQVQQTPHDAMLQWEITVLPNDTAGCVLKSCPGGARKRTKRGGQMTPMFGDLQSDQCSVEMTQEASQHQTGRNSASYFAQNLAAAMAPGGSRSSSQASAGSTVVAVRQYRRAGARWSEPYCTRGS